MGGRHEQQSGYVPPLLKGVTAIVMGFAPDRLWTKQPAGRGRGGYRHQYGGQSVLLVGCAPSDVCQSGRHHPDAIMERTTTTTTRYDDFFHHHHRVDDE